MGPPPLMTPTMTRFLLAMLFSLATGSVAGQTLPPVPTDPARSQPDTAMADMAFGTHRYCPDGACRTVGLGIGAIRADTPEKFKAFMRQNPDVDTLYLHGPGGALTGGLKLGVALRELGMNTALTARMRCFSACAYAFLGGVERSVEEGGLLGVHQFASEGADPVGEDVIQSAQSLLETYMRSLAVPRGVLDIASRTSNEDIFLINATQARALQLDNRVSTVAKWAVGFTDSGSMVLEATGRSYGSDRVASLTLGKVDGVVAIVAAFNEPGLSSEVRRRREIQGDTMMVICRHDGQRPIDKNKCLAAVPTVPWHRPEARLHGAVFAVPERELAALMRGVATDELAIGVWGGAEGEDRVILLNTQAAGFTQGMKVILGQ